MPFPFPTRSQARFLSWTVPLPTSSTWRRPNSSFRQGSSRQKMKFLVFAVCYDLFSSFLRTIMDTRLPVGLACTTCTGVSSRTGCMTTDLLFIPLWRAQTYSSLHYDTLHPTMTSLTSSYLRLETRYYIMTSWLLVGYKATVLRGMSSECSLFIVLQSDLSSPLVSTLYFLPKDQTLKRVIKQRKGPPYVAEHFSHSQTTLSPHGLVSSLRIAQAPHRVLLSDDPVVS